jgi:hypothetical protein
MPCRYGPNGDRARDEYGCGNTDCRECYTDPKKFWESVTQTAAEVSTWPKWKGGDGIPRAKLLQEMASDGTEAL